MGPPKAHAQGVIDIPPELTDLLKSLCDGKKPDDFLFTNKKGLPYLVADVSKRFTRLRELAGLPVGRFHDLRHTHGTVLIDEGVSMPTVQQRLRHKRLSTTADIYSHAIAGRQREAAEKFAQRRGRQLGGNLVENPDAERK